MVVKELIEELQKLPQDTEVRLSTFADWELLVAVRYHEGIGEVELSS